MKTTRERFEFSLFVPGIRLPTRKGLSAPKPLGKGHLEPLKRPNGTYKTKSNGALVWGDTPEVYAWVNKIAGAVLQKRSHLIASGYDPFPYRGAVKASALFVYERPATQLKGHPVTEKGPNAQRDLDSLFKALGDALTPTRDPNYPMGDILAGDNLITGFDKVYKRFIDEVDWYGGIPQGAGVYFRIEPDDDPIDIRDYV